MNIHKRKVYSVVKHQVLFSKVVLDVLELFIYGSQSYLVLQVLRLLLLVVATVDTPDKVMEVVLEELLTVSLTH